MDKGCNRIFFTVVVTVLVIGIATFVLEWIFKIGDAQLSQLSDVVVCEEVTQPSGVYYVEVTPIITGTVHKLFVCGFLETDGRPARLLVTVRDSTETLVYDQYGEYAPGNVQFPFMISIGEKDTYTICISKGHIILAETKITITDP
jgi:hypothetical protein